MLDTVKNSKKSMRGFSIIEIMITMAIVAGIIIGIAVLIRTNTAKIKVNEAKTKIENLQQSIEEFHITNRRYPSTDEGLTAALGQGVSEKDRNSMTLDPWGKPLNYASPGTHNPDTYDLWSSGPDGISGSADDIGNW